MKKRNTTEHFTRKMFCDCEMPPNTSPEKCSVIVTIYKYFEAESEERHQSIAGIKCLKEHCQIADCVFSMYSYVNQLYFSILHFRVFNVFLTV